MDNESPTGGRPRSTAKIGDHPIHPMLIPFPIAFFVATLLCDIAYARSGNGDWATASMWLLGAGVVMAMLAAEGALLGVVGGVAGLGLGVAISQVLIHVVNPQSFHWTMRTRLPLPLFAAVAFALIVASAGTALLAGRRALSAEAVQAVREDW